MGPTSGKIPRSAGGVGAGVAIIKQPQEEGVDPLRRLRPDADGRSVRQDGIVVSLCSLGRDAIQGGRHGRDRRAMKRQPFQIDGNEEAHGRRIAGPLWRPMQGSPRLIERGRLQRVPHRMAANGSIGARADLGIGDGRGKPPRFGGPRASKTGHSDAQQGECHQKTENPSRVGGLSSGHTRRSDQGKMGMGWRHVTTAMVYLKIETVLVFSGCFRFWSRRRVEQRAVKLRVGSAVFDALSLLGGSQFDGTIGALLRLLGFPGFGNRDAVARVAIVVIRAQEIAFGVHEQVGLGGIGHLVRQVGQ